MNFNKKITNKSLVALSLITVLCANSSAFAQTNTQSQNGNTNQNSTESTLFQQIKSSTDNVRKSHNDEEQANPNIHVPKDDR